MLWVNKMSISEFENNFKTLKNQWTAEAYENYEKHTGKKITERPHNNEVDAYRHAYVSGKLTQAALDNQWIAELVLDGHEVKSPNSPLEHRMDGWNNEVGRVFGDEYSADQLGKKLADELKDDGLLAKNLSDVRLKELHPDDPKIAENTDGVSDNDMDQITIDAREKIAQEIEAKKIDKGESDGSYNWNELFEIIFGTYGFSKIVPSYNGAEHLTSPIIMDLDGDGVETLSVQNKIYFDHDGNGLSELSGWVDSDDGLLVLDRNLNGVVDSGKELFGNNTILLNGFKSKNGFEALQELDENSDGSVNTVDASWKYFKIWKDSNSNGIVDDGELLSMADAGVASINTEYKAGSSKDAAGNEHRETGSFTKVDGTSGTATDVWFTVDPARTHYVGDVELSDAVKALPNAIGYGELPDLQVAMASDETLQALVTQYVNSEDAGERQKLLEPIIYQWAGVADVAPDSRDPTKIYGHVMDARQLETLEKLTGTPYVGTWCWGERDPNPHGRAAPVLIEQFNRFASFVESQLLAQSHYKDAFNAITLKYDEGSESFVPDWSGFEKHMEGLLGTDDDMIIELADMARKLGNYSPELSSAVEHSLNRLSVSSPALAALLDTKNAVGTVGNDYLTTGSGNEVLYGKGGNDQLFGGAGDDSYFFDQGDGKDRIYDSAGNDKIVFREGVARENVEFSRNLTTVWIKLKDNEGQLTGDEIQLDNFFDFDGSLKEGAIESVEFADGTTLSQADMLAALVAEATDGDDQIFGTGQDDRQSGKAGDDQIYGFAGDDVIHGDAGNDVLSGVRATMN